MKVLLDMCVLTELRHPRGNPAVKAAVALIPDDEIVSQCAQPRRSRQGRCLAAERSQKRAPLIFDLASYFSIVKSTNITNTANNVDKCWTICVRPFRGCSR